MGKTDHSAPLPDGALSVSTPREEREAEIRSHIQEILDPLGAVSTGKKNELTEKLTSFVITQEETYSGDFPHPVILRGLEEVVPGSAAKIVEMAVAESHHRHSWENRALDGNFKLASRGQISGFVLSFSLILGGFVLGLVDKQIVACAMLVPGVLGTAMNLIRGSKARQQEAGDTEKEPARSSSVNATKAGGKQVTRKKG